MIQRMAALLAFLSFILPGLGVSVYEITAYVSGMAEFRCYFDNKKNISVNQLIYSWEKQTRNEKQEKLVVAELYMGERKYNHISERYRNRFMEFMPNGDLRMFNITLEDEGVYHCYVRYKLVNIILMGETEHKLNVLANFSIPQITNKSLDGEEVDSDVKFHCSSTDGFPKPDKVLWVVSYGNETEFYHPPCDIKENSRTFNISSYLTVRVKSNTSVTCTVLAHHNFTSRIHHIVIKNGPIMETPEMNDHLKYILPCGILISCAVACLTYYCYWRKGKSKSGPSTNGIVSPTTTAPDNGSTQQREETTSFIGDNVEVNVS
ncbi:T-lymphocyte activation antigen CD86-like [Bufo gargarizans]|uniref:T-lymphocyte activation antigen CD86-like n=1 Tax=Bufo gargarizans TaxID=30331 RepID=UPI001CF2F3EC|nr:T-lymphocyte activation antigen CD86-like [Bufo gargarizans]